MCVNILILMLRYGSIWFIFAKYISLEAKMRLVKDCKKAIDNCNGNYQNALCAIFSIN